MEFGDEEIKITRNKNLEIEKIEVTKVDDPKWDEELIEVILQDIREGSQGG
jgi:dissimilatory sulfite reductase (desulfoviridin) alpha/beta subunit